MSKERMLNRREFLILATLTAAGLAATYKLRRHLSLLESSPELSQDEIEQFKGFDIVLVFNPGGWGYTSLEQDPGWKEILENVEKELKNRGYKAKILEEPRRQSPFLPPLISSENMARKIKQLTEAFPDLKIVLTGRSSGATFIEKVLKELPENEQVLAIEATRPLSKKTPLVAPKRTLVIENQYDPVEEGDLWRLLRNGTSPHVFIGEGGDFGIGKLRINFNIHGESRCCAWDDHVAEAIRGFLDVHFPLRK